MSSLSRDINNVIKKHKIKRIYMLTAIILSFAVLFMVVSSLIRPAISATRLDNSSNTIDDAKMLVGENSELYKNSSDKSVSGLISKANNDYALGIASQFSVFLNGDFKPKAADTEGRVAVGGSFDPSGYIYGSVSGTGYNVGLGHYVNDSTSISLSDLDVLTGSDYAHAIINGSYVGNKLAYKPKQDESLCRRFLVNSNTSLDSYYSGQEWAFYKADSEPIIDFDAAFSILKQRSNTISANAKSKNTTVELVKDSGGKVTEVVFDGKASGETAQSIMFNFSKDLWNELCSNADSGGVKFSFKNIPNLKNSLSGKQADLSGNVTTTTWDNSYIMINVESGSSVSVPYVPIHTFVNGTEIGKNESNSIANNHFGCETLLYNFSNATSLTLGMDFQGTILAPQAAVTDTPLNGGCPGHLSGALIAQSFEGYTEFGYRPYTGPIEVLGTSVNYTVNVDKLDGDSNFLAGATLGLYEVSNGTLSENPVQTWTSGSSTKVISLDPDKKYALKEITPPEGYQQTNDIYYFDITEGEKKTAEVTVGQTTGSSSQTTETDLWSGSLDLGSDWSTYVTLSADKFSTIKSGDKIKVYLSGVQSNAQIQIQDSSWNDIFGLQDVSGSSAEFTVTDDTLSKVQSGVYVKGQNATVSKVTLVTTTSSTDPVDITVETSYVSSVTFKQYSDSSFSNSTESVPVKPYNTSDLSKVSYKIGSADVKGSEVDSQYKQVVGDCTFVVKDGTILTPTVNFKTFEFVNTPVPKGANIVLKKVDSSTGTTLSDSSVSLYSSDNTKIGTYTLGEITLPDSNTVASYFDSNKLKPGTYYLIEETVPVGYVDSIKGEKLAFTVNSDGSVSVGTDDLSKKWLKTETSDSTTTIKILNEQGGSLDIEKKWQNKNGEAITPPENANVTVKLYRTTNSASVNQINQMSEEGTGIFALTRASSTGDDSWFTIENILSNYQFFVSGDINCSGRHIVGGIAAGGDATIGSGLQGQISPSIIAGNFTYDDVKPGDWITKDIENASKEIYSNSSYINFETAMNKIASQSVSLKNKGTQIDTGASYITVDNSYWAGTKYSIDLSKVDNKNIVIPYSIYKNAGAFNFTGVTLEEFARNGYVISIEGIDNNDISINFAGYGEEKPYILLNDSGMVNDNALKNLSGVEQGGQLCITGMNLVWNFPDAKGKITSSYLGGHIVAPYADVEITGGNFEGGVISKSVTVTNQAHFFSYLPYDQITVYTPGSSGEDPSSSSSSSESSSSSSSSSSSESSSSGGSGSEPTGDFVMDIILNKDNNWKQTISGLPVEDEEGNKYQYYVVEDPVIDGYKPSYSDQPVTLTKGGTATITITNTQDAYVLPSTGGIGSTVFYISGGALTLLGAVMLVIKRRKAFKL